MNQKERLSWFMLKEKKKGIGIPKITSVEVIKKRHVNEGSKKTMTSDKIEWRKKIHVSNLI